MQLNYGRRGRTPSCSARIALSCKWALAAVFASTACALADGMTECDKAFIFTRSPLNVVIAQYEYARSDEEVLPDASEDVYQTAYSLTYLTNLDLFLNARFHGFSVVSLERGFSERSKNKFTCSSDLILKTITRRFRPPPGKFMSLLTGRIYQEGDAVFFRSQLLPGHFVNGQFVANDELRIALRRPNGSSIALSAPVLDGEIVFPSRSLSASDMKAIVDDFERTTLVYPQKGRGTPEPLHEKRQEYGRDGVLVFTIEQNDRDGWVKIKFRNSSLSHWLRTDPAASAAVRRKFPELDFVEGLNGYLIGRSDPASSMDNLRLAIDRSLSTYLDRASDAEPAPQRAVALILRGAAQVAFWSIPADGWAKAREHFRAAAALDPNNVAARNLGILADIALCCADGRTPDSNAIDAITKQLYEILGRRPNDRYALKNLQMFFDYLSSRSIAPASAFAGRRDQVKSVRRVLGYCQKEQC